MRGTFLLGFLLFLPPVAALGHDLNLAYGHGGEIDITQPFRLSDVGWLWQKYSDDTMRIAKAGFDSSTWNHYILPILKTKAVIATVLPLAIFLSVILTLKAMRSGAFVLKKRMGGGKNSGSGSKIKKGSKDFGYGADKKAAPVKYTRK